MLINHIFNFHKKKKQRPTKSFLDSEKSSIRKCHTCIIHTNTLFIQYVLWEKKNLSDTRTDGRGKLHVYSILMEQTDNN